MTCLPWTVPHAKADANLHACLECTIGSRYASWAIRAGSSDIRQPLLVRILLGQTNQTTTNLENQGHSNQPFAPYLVYGAAFPTTALRGAQSQNEK